MMGASAVLNLNMHPVSQRVSWGISVLNSIRWADQALGVGQGFKYFSDVQKDLEGWDKLNANINTPLLRQTSIYQKVMEKSQYMANRENENVQQFREVFNDIYGKTNIRFKLGDHVVNVNEMAGIGARMMNLTDMSINLPAWDMVYRGYMEQKGLAKIQQFADSGGKMGADQGTVEKEAIALADKCVFETQPLSSRENASQFMRDKKNVLNMMFLFRSYTSFSAGRQAAMFKEMQNGIISKEEYASHVGIDMFLEPMAQVAFRTLWSGQKFATPAFAIKLALAPIAQGMAGAGGTLGMVASDWLRKMIGADKNDKIKIDPAKAIETSTELPFIKNIKRPFTAFHELSQGGIHTERGVLDMLDGLNFYYGVGGGTPFPVENLWREFQGMRNVLNVASPDKGQPH